MYASCSLAHLKSYNPDAHSCYLIMGISQIQSLQLSSHPSLLQNLHLFHSNPYPSGWIPNSHLQPYPFSEYQCHSHSKFFVECFNFHTSIPSSLMLIINPFFLFPSLKTLKWSVLPSPHTPYNLTWRLSVLRLLHHWKIGIAEKELTWKPWCPIFLMAP